MSSSKYTTFLATSNTFSSLQPVLNKIANSSIFVNLSLPSNNNFYLGRSHIGTSFKIEIIELSQSIDSI